MTGPDGSCLTARHRMHPRLRVLLMTALLLGPGSMSATLAAADTVAVTIRSGNHPDFGRIVFDAPPRVAYRVVRDGDHLTVQFADDVALTGDPKLPRNVAGLHADHAQAVLTVAAGATFHDARLGDHVVIDVFDPASASGNPAPQPPAQASGRPSPASAPPSAQDRPASKPHASALPARLSAAARARRQNHPAPPRHHRPPPRRHLPPRQHRRPLRRHKLPPRRHKLPPGRSPATSAAPAPAAGSVPTPAPPPASATATPPPAGATPAAEPTALVASPVTLPPETKGSAFSLPCSGDVGAAVFRRGGETMLVFDDRRPIDMSALRSDAAFAGARVELLPAGTLIRVTPPPGTAVTLTRTPQSWTVAALAAPPQPAPFIPEAGDASLSVAARDPGSVLAVADPVTGGTLLVGTQRQSGQAMLALRRTAQFTLLPTAQGVVVVPLADTVALRAVPNGFALTTAPDPLAVSRGDADLLGDAAALTHRFEFPALPNDQLIRQLSAQIAAAAAEPLLARGPKRRAAAITMIGLGMGAEAEALLQLTAADDPRQAASADVIGLTAVAAMLAGRPAEADGIDDPRLTGTDEVVLWRALRAAMRDDTSPVAAIALASTAPLLLSYPPPIRDRMLPLAVEAMVQGGANTAAAALLTQSKGLPGLDLARAMLAQAKGDTDAALGGLRRVGGRP